MQLARSLPLALAAALAGLAASSTPALAAGSIRAAYVEQVIPGRTFTDSVTVLNSSRATGPVTGILGVSSITLTNFDTSAQQVFVFVPIFSGGATTCSGTIVGGMAPNFTVYVPPQSTLHLPLPTPLVISPASGPTCIAAQVTTILHGGSVQMLVNGVVN